MRVPREACLVVFRTFSAEIIEHQEGVKAGLLPAAECPPQPHSSALQGGTALDYCRKNQRLAADFTWLRTYICHRPVLKHCSHHRYAQDRPHLPHRGEHTGPLAGLLLRGRTHDHPSEHQPAASHPVGQPPLSLIHISEPTRLRRISY